jgi:hypothetical protein
LDAYGVEADISQPTISAETVENDPKQTLLASLARDRAPLSAGIVLELHWPSTAIMTLRAAACRLAISGR